MATSRYEDALKEYRRLAKKADQRMVRLEKLSQQPGYKSVKQFAYARAKRDIEAWQGGKKQQNPRFNTAPPATTQALEAKIRDIKRFLEAPSSTKASIKKIYEKGVKTTNERYGTDFTWEDLAIYFETQQAKNNAARYGSKTLIKALAIVKNIGPDPEAIKEAKKKHTVLSDDAVVDEIAHRLLKAGQTSTKLFGK